MKIDVIIPIYEAEKFIDNALFSLVNQTIKDEILITLIDDGSSCKYDYIILKYQRKLKINYIQLRKNHGQGYAKQLGIRKTKNPYLLFMDADDKLTKKNAVEILLKEAQYYCSKRNNRKQTNNP